MSLRRGAVSVSQRKKWLRLAARIASLVLGVVGGVWGFVVAVLYLTISDAATDLGYLVKVISSVVAMPVFLGGVIGAVLVFHRPRRSAYLQVVSGVVGGALTLSLGIVGAILLVIGALLAYSVEEG